MTLSKGGGGSTSRLGKGVIRRAAVHLGAAIAISLPSITCTTHPRSSKPSAPTRLTPSTLTATPSSPTNLSEIILSVALVSPEQGWVLTDRRLLHTYDGGVSWRGVSVSASRGNLPPSLLPGQFFVDGSIAWIARVDSTVTVTRVSAESGQVESSKLPNLGSYDEFFASLSFLNANRGWASIGHSSDINIPPTSSDLYHTMDGGRTWSLVSRNTPVVGAIHFSISTGWAIQNPMLRTLDGGRTWHAQHIPIHFDPALGANYDSLSFFGSDGVLEARIPTGMQGYPDYVVTSDGGKTWRERPPDMKSRDSGLNYNNTGPPLSFSAVDAHHWRASIYDHIMATNDAGLHWTEVAKKLPFHIIQGLSFATPDVGWAFSIEPDNADCIEVRCTSRLEATNDGGRTWNELRLPARSG